MLSQNEEYCKKRRNVAHCNYSISVEREIVEVMAFGILYGVVFWDAVTGTDSQTDRPLALLQHGATNKVIGARINMFSLTYKTWRWRRELEKMQFGVVRRSWAAAYLCVVAVWLRL